ncbi:MAG: nucleotide exchange factor GrpE [Gammaproteobacteria bacterium GWF2_41_13]|nr:MAG: nucleotide exchange factor GrpE [Gammaproteobacteria bacterium GWF2_41_13]
MSTDFGKKTIDENANILNAMEILEENPNPQESEEISPMQKELIETKDKLLRTLAEMENIRNRTKMDIEKAHKYGLEKFAQALLPIVDSLEKALDSMSAADRAHAQGVELTLKLFLETLEKFNIKPINPLQQSFDPSKHEAISVQPMPEVKPNTVVTVFQKGYELQGRLIRPALVIVSQ